MLVASGCGWCGEPARGNQRCAALRLVWWTKVDNWAQGVCKGLRSASPYFWLQLGASLSEAFNVSRGNP